MQTHTDRRSPSQVKVGHREGAEQGKVQVLTRFFHAHFVTDATIAFCGADLIEVLLSYATFKGANLKFLFQIRHVLEPSRYL